MELSGVCVKCQFLDKFALEICQFFRALRTDTEYTNKVSDEREKNSSISNISHQKSGGSDLTKYPSFRVSGPGGQWT